MEGIDGIAPLVSWRGAPGLEGYPGVVLRQAVSKNSRAKRGRGFGGLPP
jgi:hypothetical protein